MVVPAIARIHKPIDTVIALTGEEEKQTTRDVILDQLYEPTDFHEAEKRSHAIHGDDRAFIVPRSREHFSYAARYLYFKRPQCDLEVRRILEICFAVPVASQPIRERSGEVAGVPSSLGLLGGVLELPQARPYTALILGVVYRKQHLLRASKVGGPFETDEALIGLYQVYDASHELPLACQ